MKKYGVIVAGGIGVRMNSGIPKQFLLLKDKPVIFYTLDTFLRAYDDLQMILVLPQAHRHTGQAIVNRYFDNGRVQIVNGGITRFHSVQNGLSHIPEEAIVFVHDGVRCLLTTDLIHRCYDAAVEHGSAIPVITARDSVRMITETGNQALDRNVVKLVQTPQTFQSRLLLHAYKMEYRDTFTDEATVVEASGHEVNLIEGEENNMKITTPDNLIYADACIPVIVPVEKDGP